LPKSQVEITMGLLTTGAGRTHSSAGFKNHPVEARKVDPRNFLLLNMDFCLWYNLIEIL
jgi:hypothetical protein